MELKDKVVVITGGSKGLGRSLAETLIKEGAKVSICSPDEQEIKKAGEDIGALAVVADVRSERDMQKLADETIKKYGGIDIWINNAGIWMADVDMEDAYEEKVKQMFDVNVFGLMNGTRVALKHMDPLNSGAVVNILSVAGITYRSEINAYCASKWAGNGYTGAVREKMKDKNISILAVYPGGMRTGIFGDYVYKDYPQFMDPVEVAGKIVANLKLENPEKDLVIKRNKPE